MYNSFVIRFLVKIWNLFIQGYDNSLIKTFFNKLKMAIKYLFFGSVTKDIFVSDKSIIEVSLFYKIYKSIIDTLSKLIKKINTYIKKIGNSSIIYRSLGSLAKDNGTLASTIFSFILFFAVGIVLNNIFRGLWSGRSYIIAFVFIIVSIMGIILEDKSSEVLKNSFVFRFVMGLFDIDEGEINWL